MATKVLQLVDSFPTLHSVCRAQLGLRGTVPRCYSPLRLELRSRYMVQSRGRCGRGRGGGGTFGPQDSPSPSSEHVWRGVWHIKEPFSGLQLQHVVFQRPGSRHRAVSRLICRRTTAACVHRQRLLVGIKHLLRSCHVWLSAPKARRRAQCLNIAD